MSDPSFLITPLPVSGTSLSCSSPPSAPTTAPSSPSLPLPPLTAVPPPIADPAAHPWLQLGGNLPPLHPNLFSLNVKNFVTARFKFLKSNDAHPVQHQAFATSTKYGNSTCNNNRGQGGKGKGRHNNNRKGNKNLGAGIVLQIPFGSIQFPEKKGHGLEELQGKLLDMINADCDSSHHFSSERTRTC
ncbi:hypothetical protein Cgig2_020850 [Carnegiea gigantea]|uniref:Uncharacterized protein n=1 Tax=Carnegiea gigantea TaxID=171969 RepID=A0A9Q1KI92_9CARY|nr:hypothetical protein Cgig2_020850 [Carnegiea gigantea]